jgi:hypothetical protein
MPNRTSRSVPSLKFREVFLIAALLLETSSSHPPPVHARREAAAAVIAEVGYKAATMTEMV